MYNTAHFSRMPRSELPGTRMKKPQLNSGTSLHGDITPLFCNLVMPGQIDKCIANGKIWMSTPIAPIMSQIRASIHTFFVPLRLVWNHTKEFFGENKTSSGPQETIYTIPRTTMNDPSKSDTQVKVGSVSHYLHKPLYKGSSIDSSNKLLVSVLKERAYWLVISEYYRAQQVQNPFIINMGDVSAYDANPIGTIGTDKKTFSSMPAKCLKDFDYFTTATISPNYGGEVLLPLGSVAPVYASATTHGFLENAAIHFVDYDDHTELAQSGFLGLKGGSSSTTKGYMHQYSGTSQGTTTSISGYNDNGAIAPDNLWADLSHATAAKIDDLYTAMAAQAFYHNANYGSRYFEMIQIHYGVSNPDLVLDRPEHVSEYKFDIIVQDVVSTAGAASDSSSKLGQPGAYSKTMIRKSLYNHSFGEWGFVICLMNTYHQRYYSGGTPREDLYTELFDFYFPEFANRGDDFIFKGEIFSSSANDGKSAFGFQEAYADRRYYPSTATGQLDAYCDASVNGKNAIGRWILNEKWSNAPLLNEEFLLEDREAISDALVSGENGPDYVWDFNFEHFEILPMPAYSKPGVPNFGRGLI